MTSENSQPPLRPPLNLPRGSVRALLALSIFGSTMGLLAMGKAVEQGLWLINYVMLGYYFASRSGNAGAPAETNRSQPLGLPRGTVRWLLILSFLGTMVYLGFQWHKAGKSFWKHPAFFPLLSLSSFFLGRLVKALMSPLVNTKGPRSSLTRKIQDTKAITVLLCAIAIILLCLVGVSFQYDQIVKNFCFTFVLFYYGSR